MKRIVLLSLLSLACATTLHAEKADSAKPSELEFDQSVSDDIKQVFTFSGNVVLTRGTLVIKAGKAIATKDPAGNQFLSLFAAPGKVVTFRQKRDGGDLWVEGQAERIEYDDRTEIMKFFSKAKLKQLEGTRPTNEVEGEFIAYNSRTEIFSVNSLPNGESKPGAGRGKMIFQRDKPAKDAGK